MDSIERTIEGHLIMPKISPIIPLTKKMIKELNIVGGEFVLFERVQGELHVSIIPSIGEG